MKISDIKIGTRLALAFGLCVVLIVALAAIAASSLRGVSKELDFVINDRYAKVKILGDIKERLDLQTRLSRDALLFEREDQRLEALRQNEVTRNANAAAYEKLKPMLASEEGKRQFEQLSEQRKIFMKAMLEFEDLVKRGQMTQARAYLLDQVRPRQLEFSQILENLSGYQEQLMDKSSKDAANEVTQSTMLVIAISSLAALFAVFSGWLITRSIVRPVLQAVLIAETVARGDLSIRIETESRDELGQLLGALRTMNSNLVDIVSKVRAGTDSIATGSQQIAAGNQDLSSRTEEQASNLQQTAASMEQLTSTVKQNADAAKQANQLAGVASDVATKGGETVGQVVNTMQAITESSKKIAEIIGVIDGIAFQTNILALNAAVEAARAGEQGRGFAVVAGEVRSLAQRSAQAAREIKSLISDSVQKVETGSRQVSEAGSTMDEIVTQVRRVTDLIGEITSATSEQSSGISQVGGAVQQLDQVTQQNAALVEESAAAADSLREQAAKLAQAVAVFKLSQHDEQAALTTAPRSTAKASFKSATNTMKSRAKKISSTSTGNHSGDAYASTRSTSTATTATATAKAQPVTASATDDWQEF